MGQAQNRDSGPGAGRGPRAGSGLARGPENPSFLFVYGLLQSYFRRNRFSRLLARQAELLGSATLPGRIYGLRRYPCLRPPQGAEDIVRGEIYRLRTPEVTLPVLDAYEDAAYRRVARRARLVAGGREIRCWVYLYKMPLPRHRWIAEGRWTPEMIVRHRPF